MRQLMTEKQRRIDLIKTVATRGHKPKTKAELLALVEPLKTDRPQLFHATLLGNTGTPMYSPIRNEQDIGDLRNSMACGNYPLSMTDCEVVGINGDCGLKCPVLLRGDCDCQDDMFASG